MKEDMNTIISALIGLVGACSNNPKTDNTDNLVIKALAFPLICLDYDDKAFQELVNDIHAEKNLIAPGCTECTAPCGNTSDYDMRRIYGANAEIREVKLQLLAKLQALAAYEKSLMIKKENVLFPFPSVAAPNAPPHWSGL